MHKKMLLVKKGMHQNIVSDFIESFIFRFFGDNPETIIHVRLMDWRKDLKNIKHLRVKQKINACSMTS